MSTDNVTQLFPTATPDSLLDAFKGELTHAIIMGYDDQNRLRWACSDNVVRTNDMLYIMKEVEHFLLARRLMLPVGEQLDPNGAEDE